MVLFWCKCGDEAGCGFTDGLGLRLLRNGQTLASPRQMAIVSLSVNYGETLKRIFISGTLDKASLLVVIFRLQGRNRSSSFTQIGQNDGLINGIPTVGNRLNKVLRNLPAQLPRLRIRAAQIAGPSSDHRDVMVDHRQERGEVKAASVLTWKVGVAYATRAAVKTNRFREV
jgi:hypothetical protein